MDEPLAMRRMIADAQHQVLGVADRLHSSPAPDLVMTAFAAELEQQDALFEGIGLADIAHTIMLIEVGVIPADEGAALLSFLLKLQPRPRDFVPDPALGDLYTNREAWLSARTAAAGWLGAGRARREATTTGYLVVTRWRLLEMIGALIETGRAIADCAERHRDSLMPDYTYLQAGQPTTFAHFLLGFGCALTRDLERARALFGRINLSPAGCGSSNGSLLPQDRERLAALLGFDGLVRHARDAMWEADLPIEALGVATAALVNLDRLAEDLMIFSTAEFGFVELADAHARASKIMPQKKNPFALGYIRAVANQLIGVQTAMAVCGRTPTGHMDNRMQPYGDVPRALGTAAGAAKLMGKSIAELTFDHSRARHALEFELCMRDRSRRADHDKSRHRFQNGPSPDRAAHARHDRQRRAQLPHCQRRSRRCRQRDDRTSARAIATATGRSCRSSHRRITPHRNWWGGSRNRERRD